MTDPDDEWDGVCACGKADSDGVRCRLGATHVDWRVDKGVAFGVVGFGARSAPDEKPSIEDMLA